MAWIVHYIDGRKQEVGGSDLRLLAANGDINRDTTVFSTTRKKTCRAGDIAGLVFQSDCDFDFVESPQPMIEAKWEDVSTLVRSMQPASHPGTQKTFVDMQFDRMWTPMLCGWAWIGYLGLSGMSCLVVVVRAIRDSSAAMGEQQTQQLVYALSVFAGWILATFVVRIAIEFVVVVFKCAEYLRVISDKENQ